MRLPESKIKQNILHPDEEVRSMAVKYFSGSFSQDTSIMPLVIQAVERYGRKDTTGIIYKAGWLKQTDDTILWVIEELNKNPDLLYEDSINYFMHLSYILYRSSLDLLLKYEDKILDAPNLIPSIKEEIIQFLNIYNWGFEKLWKALEELCQRNKDRYQLQRKQEHFADNLIRALSYHGRRNYDKVISLLGKEIDNYENNPMMWMELFVVQLAGRLRLESAIPLIINKYDEDGDYLNDCCNRALEEIGTDAVVETIFTVFTKSKCFFRSFTSEVLEHIHSDYCVKRCLEFIKKERDLTVLTNLAIALLSNFSYEGLDYVYKLVKKGMWDHIHCDLKGEFVWTAILMDKRYPEHDGWERYARKQLAKRKFVIEKLKKDMSLLVDE